VLTAGLERMAMCRQMRSVQLAARKYRKAFRALVALKSFGPSRPGDAPRDQYANDSRNEDTNESTNNAVGPEYRKRYNVDDAATRQVWHSYASAVAMRSNGMELTGGPLRGAQPPHAGRPR